MNATYLGVGEGRWLVDPLTFPELDGYEPGSLARHGYTPFTLSVFDHVLSENEAECSTVMFFSHAVEVGALEDYLRGEERLTRLLGCWASSGVAAIADGAAHDLGAVEFAAVLQSSLREECLMDVWFPRMGLRAMGGYDRSTILLTTEVTDLARLANDVRAAGVFLL